MLVRDFDFHLPPEQIAQQPAAERSGARLLVLERGAATCVHRRIADLPELLLDGDLVVVNDTRVFPARLLGHREPSGGAVECLLVAPAGAPAHPSEELWEALMHPGPKLKPGARVRFDGAPLYAEVLERRFHGRRLIRLWTSDGSRVQAVIDAVGHTPLPPYIKRDDTKADRERYQTVFAKRRGSVAAPTAGLHFDAGMVQRLRDRGIGIASITLHVGYGTFQPVRVERVEDHRVHEERFEIDEEAALAVNRALDERRRVIAVGTTTTRALETAGRDGNGRIAAGPAVTSLFIYPGFEFKVVQGLLTNFHLPRSSLLMLVCAFAGRDPVLRAYAEAVAAGYRFYSYGDAMLIL